MPRRAVRSQHRRSPTRLTDHRKSLSSPAAESKPPVYASLRNLRANLNTFGRDTRAGAHQGAAAARPRGGLQPRGPAPVRPRDPRADHPPRALRPGDLQRDHPAGELRDHTPQVRPDPPTPILRDEGDHPSSPAQTIAMHANHAFGTMHVAAAPDAEQPRSRPCHGS
jgi:hypothetical protein